MKSKLLILATFFLIAVWGIAWFLNHYNIPPVTTADWAYWVTAVVAIFGLGTLVVICWQIQADHDRSRRERTIELLQFWAREMATHTPNIYFARQLAGTLNDFQCEQVWNLRELKVSKDFEHLITGCLTNYSDSPMELKPVAHGDFELTREQVSVIRDLVGMYLNMLETVACAWFYNIADRQIIEAEFQLQLSPETGRFPLAGFLNCCKFYPSLREFSKKFQGATHLKPKQPTA